MVPQDGSCALQYCNVGNTTVYTSSTLYYCATTTVPAIDSPPICSPTTENFCIATSTVTSTVTPAATLAGATAAASTAASAEAPTATPSTTLCPLVGGKVSTGAAAGVGIGCALIGALLAGLVVFFLSRRKRHQPIYPQQHLLPNGTGYVEQEKSGTAATNAYARGGVVTNIDRLLPQPVEDDKIIGGLSKIRDSIKNHVQNYCHLSAVNHDVVDVARLVELADATAIPASVLKDLLLNPATRVPMIKLFLAQSILSKCNGQAGGQQSLLPNEVSILAASSTGADRTDGGRLALFSKWKTISGALLQQQYGQSIDENDPRLFTITQILAAIEAVLHPFINPNIDMNARRRNLEGILRRAAQFAFLLFSQPGSFQLDFIGTGQHGNLLVFPALLQTVTDEAKPLLPPRILSDKEVVSGLGV